MNTPTKLKTFFESKNDNKHFIESMRIAFHILKTDPKFPLDSVLPYIRNRLKLALSDLDSYTYNELSSLVYILKSSKELSLNSLYSSENEKNLINRIDRILEISTPNSTLANLFRDLALINRLSFKIENLLLKKLKDNKEFFSRDELRKIIVATSEINLKALSEIEDVTIERFWKMNKMLVGNEDITDCLRQFGNISKRKDIKEFLDDLLRTLSMRVDFFKFQDIKMILEFYSICDSQDKGLLYDCIARLENILENEKNIVPDQVIYSAKYLNLIKEKNPGFEIGKNLVSLFIRKILFFHESKALQLIKTLEGLSYIEKFSNFPSKELSDFVLSYISNPTSGYWKFVLFKIASKIIDISQVSFEDHLKAEKNIFEGSVYIKLRILEKILQMKNFSLNRNLLEIHNIMFDKIIIDLVSISQLVRMSSILDNIFRLIDKERLFRIQKRILDICAKEIHTSYRPLAIKHSILIYTNDEVYKKIWKTFIEQINFQDMDEIVSDIIYDMSDAFHSKIEPIACIIELIKGIKDKSLTQFFSMPCRDLNNDELSLVSDLLIRSDKNFMFLKSFKFTKGTLIHYLVTTQNSLGISENCLSLLSKLTIDLTSHKEIIKLITSKYSLDLPTIKNIQTALRNNEPENNYEDLLLDYSKIPGLFTSPSHITFFSSSLTYSADSLLKRLKAYFNLNSSLDDQEVLKTVLSNLDYFKTKFFLIDTLLTLSSSFSHQELRTQLISSISSILFQDINSYQIDVLIKIFKNLIETQFPIESTLNKLEEKIFTHKLSTSSSVYVLASYLISGRFNDRYLSLLNSLKEKKISVYLPELVQLSSQYPNKEFQSFINQVTKQD